ncbi:FAD binding domain-containing protein [Streptosporangium sp. NPDC000396]|uniref:FAD binding domain-containing protein n=1 Tax=Streptosporangium sp. NPDC000396 TaxID=3366185 RepID=UPI003688668D
MDLNTVTSVVEARTLARPMTWQPGDAWLAGGTWLFSEPQPELRRLIDLASYGWQPLRLDDQGMEISATCTLAQLFEVSTPSDWRAATLIGDCCRALLGSFKVWNAATVGGNLCLSLPAGPMISLAVSLDGVCRIWTLAGGERQVTCADFVTGVRRNVLRPGELLRSITLPVSALRCRTAFRQISLTPYGRSAALLIGRLSPDDGSFVLTVTASTVRPVRLPFPGLPGQAELLTALERRIPPDLYHLDVHGAPAWRHHMTVEFAKDIRRELSERNGA